MSDFSDDLSFAVTGATIKASGSLKKVEGFEGFDRSHPSNQSGYYLPFTVEPKSHGDAVSIQVNEKPEVTSPEDNTFIILLGADEHTGKAKTIKVKSGSTTYTMDLAGLTFIA